MDQSVTPDIPVRKIETRKKKKKKKTRCPFKADIQKEDGYSTSLTSDDNWTKVLT